MLDLYWATAFLVIAFIGSILLFKSRNELPERIEQDTEFKGMGMIFFGVTLGFMFLWERLDASLFPWLHDAIPYAGEQPELHKLTFWVAILFMYFGSMMCLAIIPACLGSLYDNKVVDKC